MWWILLPFSASYAGSIAPPGYPNTTCTPSRSRHSQRMLAPVMLFVVVAVLSFMRASHPEKQKPTKPSSLAGRAAGAFEISRVSARWFPPRRRGCNNPYPKTMTRIRWIWQLFIVVPRASDCTLTSRSEELLAAHPVQPVRRSPVCPNPANKIRPLETPGFFLPCRPAADNNQQSRRRRLPPSSQAAAEKSHALRKMPAPSFPAKSAQFPAADRARLSVHIVDSARRTAGIAMSYAPASPASQTLDSDYEIPPCGENQWCSARRRCAAEKARLPD